MPIQSMPHYEVAPSKPAAEVTEETREIVRHLSSVAGAIAIDGEKSIGEQMWDYNDLMQRLLRTLEDWTDDRRERKR